MIVCGLGISRGGVVWCGGANLDWIVITSQAACARKAKRDGGKQRPHLEKGPNAFSLEIRGHFLLLMAICTGEAKREAGGHLCSAVTVISVGNGAGAPLLGVLFLALRSLLYGC